MTKKDAMRAAVEALEFYANPNVYEADAIGRRQDIRYVAESALSLLRSELKEGEEPTLREQSLAMLLRRCARCLPPEHTTRKLATAYLKEQGFLNALRTSPTANKEPV